MVSVSSVFQAAAVAVAVNAAYIPAAQSSPAPAPSAPSAPAQPFPQLNISSPYKTDTNESTLERRFFNFSSNPFFQKREATFDLPKLNFSNVFDFTKRDANASTVAISKRGLNKSEPSGEHPEGPAPPKNGSAPFPPKFNHTGPAPSGPAPSFPVPSGPAPSGPAPSAPAFVKRGLNETEPPFPPFNGTAPFPPKSNHTGPAPTAAPAPPTQHKRDLGKIKSFLSKFRPAPSAASSEASIPTGAPAFNGTSF